jgi:cold shock CspA family protein
MKGKIKKWISSRGFGFLETEDLETDIFCHISDLPLGNSPEVGQKVEFTAIKEEKGIRAVNIKFIQ